ncbi:hypothetical protein [Amycolatopsis sp. NPDC049159]
MTTPPSRTRHHGPHADSAGLHRLAIALVVISVLLLAVTVADKGLRRDPR